MIRVRIEREDDRLAAAAALLKNGYAVWFERVRRPNKAKHEHWLAAAEPGEAGATAGRGDAFLDCARRAAARDGGL
jgi:hypothetical protein